MPREIIIYKQGEGKPNLTMAGIADLVDAMLALPKNLQRDVKRMVTHRFADGMYIREFKCPAGVAIVSMVHKTENPYVVSQGKVLVYSPGGEAQLIMAPYFGITKPGQVRILVTLSDLVWTTFHATDETDIDELEKHLAMTPREALQLTEGKKVCHVQSVEW